MLLPSPCLSVREPATRAKLRCILQHPAIAPARRQRAEQFISRCPEAEQLQQWLALAVSGCSRWEEQTLTAEAVARNGNKAHEQMESDF